MTTGDQTPAIECRHLWKIYGPHAADALQAARDEGLDKDEVNRRFGCIVGVADANFTVAEGEILCFMGLSGSGKSTLVRNINRLIEPTYGEVLINGTNICDVKDSELREMRARYLGMVFQHMALWPHRTVRDNVAFGLEVRGFSKPERRQAADGALEIVKLSDWGERYPDELSGGMQQRVGLARALAANPLILLMDEPFSALDPLIRKELQDQFIELAANMKKTTVFITHDLDEAIRVGHRISIMKDGVLVQTGSVEEILTQPKTDYVASFVQGVSGLQRIFAHTVMVSLQDAPETCVEDGRPKSPVVAPSANCNEIIDALTAGDGTVVVVENDRPVGVITTERLLHAIRHA